MSSNDFQQKYAFFFRRVDIQQLYPPFRTLVESLFLNCLSRGAPYYATSAYRSSEEQDDLYTLGRTVKNNNANIKTPMGTIVTNAKGGESAHNFGLAVDFALDGDKNKEGLQPDWSSSAYKILGEEAGKLGLEWGGNWKNFKDSPHVQLKLSKNNINLKDLNKILKQKGMAEVYKFLDLYKW